MPALSRAIAEYIVIDAIATQRSVKHGQIEATLRIDALDLDSAAKEQIQQQIVRTVESMGIRTRFSIDAFSDAQTVSDLTDMLLATTERGWLR